MTYEHKSPKMRKAKNAAIDICYRLLNTEPERRKMRASLLGHGDRPQDYEAHAIHLLQREGILSRARSAPFDKWYVVNYEKIERYLAEQTGSH